MRFVPVLGLSVVALICYFLIEGTIWTLLYVKFGNRPLSHPEDAPFVGIIDVIANLPAIATFLSLQVVRLLLVNIVARADRGTHQVALGGM